MVDECQVLIREATIKDLKDVKFLWLKLAEEMYKIEEYIFPSRENAERWFSSVVSILREGRGKVFVAQLNGEIVGFIYFVHSLRMFFEVSKQVALISDMYVKPEFRRRGIGSLLLEKCFEHLRKLDIKHVMLSVLSENLAAVKFYEKTWFQDLSVRHVKKYLGSEKFITI